MKIETWIEAGDKLPVKLWNPTTKEEKSVLSCVETGETRHIPFGVRSYRPRLVLCRRVLCEVE